VFTVPVSAISFAVMVATGPSDRWITSGCSLRDFRREPVTTTLLTVDGLCSGAAYGFVAEAMVAANAAVASNPCLVAFLVSMVGMTRLSVLLQSGGSHHEWHADAVACSSLWSEKPEFLP
jgi:hypothetical protein